MTLLSSIGLDTVVAVGTGLWFAASGIAKVRPAPTAGTRSIPVSRWITAAYHVRGFVEFFVALAVLGLAGASVLHFSVPPIALYLGFTLALSALWSSVEALIPPIRPWYAILSILSFAIAMFYTGFGSLPFDPQLPFLKG
jgi:hypothetical protein